MAAPLIVRLVMDAAGYLRTIDTAVASNTKLDASIKGVGETAALSADQRVAASLKATKALETEVVGLQKLATSATASAETQARAALLAEKAQARLNAQTGVSALAVAGSGKAAQTAEKDLGKLTRGVIAGSGAASSLGRSLAFASTGFIAVAGGATLIVSSIKAAEALGAAQARTDQQLKTGGKSWAQYGARITATEDKLRAVAGFTDTELLQAFSVLFRATNNVGTSLKFMGVASDAARALQKPLSATSVALGKALGGNLSALRRLGVSIPQNLKGMDALTFVQAKFAGQAAASTTVSQRFSAELEHSEAIIGTQLLPTFTRLTGEIAAWLTKMNDTGRLQRDVSDGLHILGIGFHLVEDAIHAVDYVTGGLNNTLRILFTVWLGREAFKAIVGIERIAASWGLVATAANAAAAAEERAAVAGGEAGLAAGAAGAAGGAAGAAGKIGAGAFLGATIKRLLGRGTPVGAARFAVGPTGIATELGAGEAGAAAAGVSATGIGALAVAAVVATQALDSLAKTVNNKAGGGNIGNQIIDGIAGVLTGGLVGNYRYGIIGQALHGFPGFGPPKSPEQIAQEKANAAAQDAIIARLKRGEYGAGAIFGRGSVFAPGGTLGRAISSPTGARREGHPFGSVTPIAVYTQYSQTISEQIAGAQAALTKTTKDDVANAKAIIRRIKRLIDRGHLAGASLVQGLQDEASQQSVLDNARQEEAQKAAAIAAAKKQAASSYTTPIDLQLAEARAQLTTSSADDIKVEKQILAAAKAAIASGKKNKQGQLAALQAQLSAKQAIESLSQQNTTSFTLPLRLQLQLARAQALGTNQGPILLRMKAALEKALKAAHGNIQKQIDIYNQIASINQQLGADAQTAFGQYKQASLKAETAGLGLTHAQQKALEARLSQRGPHGTVPGEGTGAGGYIIGPDGRPIQVHRHRRPDQGRDVTGGGGGGGRPQLHATFNVRIYLDGHDITRSVTIRQQKTRDRNPSQRRGPHAGKTSA